MDERLTDQERDEAEVEAETVGSTAILTEGGWEATDYVAPDDTWRLLEDGSYLSPDGRMRSWPMLGAESA